MGTDIKDGKPEDNLTTNTQKQAWWTLILKMADL